MIGCGQSFAIATIELPFVDHVHDLDAGNENAGAANDRRV